MSKNTQPPKNTLRAWSSRDLSQDREVAKFRVQNADGSESTIVAEKRVRQVLDSLRETPIYCASPVRISETVRVLRHELGVEIETERYDGNNGQYGVYFLTSQVTPISGEAA